MYYSSRNAQLASICEIQSGYTARARLEPLAAGGVPAIQLRDLRGEHELDPAGLPLYALTGSLHRYRAGAGDVLFRSRGERNTAVPICPEARDAAVVMLPLLILRPDREAIDPRYLAWFINQAGSQRYFDACARGTNLRMIPKRCLDELEIAVPDLEIQKRIAAVDALARHERDLTIRLAEKKLELTGSALLAQVQKAKFEAITRKDLGK